MTKFNDKEPVNSDGPECPYCGAVWTADLNDLDLDEDYTEFECEDCGKTFEVKIQTTIDYHSRPQHCKSNHRFEDVGEWRPTPIRSWDLNAPPKGEMVRYRECLHCTKAEVDRKVFPECGVGNDEHAWGDWGPWVSYTSAPNKEFRLRMCVWHHETVDTEERSVIS